MITTKQIPKKEPRFGFISDIARVCKCTRQTVSAAIYHNSKGEKAEFVRRYYRATYKQFS